MPDEENQAVETEDQVTETPDVVDAGEQPEETVEVNATDELWREVAPDLAEHIGALSPEAREGILLKRLAAQAAGAHPNGDQSQGDVADRGAEPQSPPAMRIPTYDPEALTEGARQALEEGNGEKLAAVMGEFFGAVNGVLGLVGDAQNEMGVKMTEMGGRFKKAMRPAQFRKVLGEVPGAAESDFAAAEALLDSKEATTAVSALKLVVYDRQQELTVPNAKASGDAVKRAAAVAANRLSGGPRTSGQPANFIPSTDAEWKEHYKREAETNNRK